jgi:hypothetical protein
MEAVMPKNPGDLATPKIDATEQASPSQVTASMPRQRKTTAAKPKRKASRPSTASSKQRSATSQSKQHVVIQMLRRQSGVTIEDIIAKTGWQPHSVRGFFSGLVKKKLKLPVVSDARSRISDKLSRTIRSGLMLSTASNIALTVSPSSRSDE